MIASAAAFPARPRPLHGLRHGVRRGLLLQGPRRLPFLQRSPHGPDRRRSLQPAGLPPTGASSCSSMTTATSFRRHLTSCPRSTFTTSDHSLTRRIDARHQAAGFGDTPRRRRKNATAGGESRCSGCRLFGPRRRGTRLTIRPSAGHSGRKCHWPGYPLTSSASEPMTFRTPVSA